MTFPHPDPEIERLAQKHYDEDPVTKDLVDAILWPDQPEMVFHMSYLESIASRCSVIIEIGCGHGNGSTRAFTHGLRRTSHPAGPRLFISVDHDPLKPDLLPSLPCWRKLTGDSRDLAPFEEAYAACQSFPVDLIYIDTDHTYSQLAAELLRWAPIASPSTIWLFHDTFMFDCYNPMTDAIKDFCALHPEWEYTELTKGSHGMGMMAARGREIPEELRYSL